MKIWSIVYKTGLLGFIIALIVAGITSVNTVLGLGLPLFIEGSEFPQVLTQFGLGVFLLSSVLLWIPTFTVENSQFKNRERVDKIIWYVSLLLMPFIATYLYFRKYCLDS